METPLLKPQGKIRKHPRHEAACALISGYTAETAGYHHQERLDNWRTTGGYLDTGVSSTQRVRSALLEMLPSGQSTIEETASRLATSKRSLQRRLSDELSSYQEVLDTTRRELAQHYLARSSISPTEIVYLLGFQEDNSFIRSFKRWTGKTPGEYRQRAQQSAPTERPQKAVAVR
jgi:AraC-like DNA-binding protein